MPDQLSGMLGTLKLSTGISYCGDVWVDLVTTLENRGAIPDFEVPMPPHTSRLRRDLQLEAAVQHSLRLIEGFSIPKAPQKDGIE